MEMEKMGKRIWKEYVEKARGEYEGRSCKRRELEPISFAVESHNEGLFLEGPICSQNLQQSNSMKLRGSDAAIPSASPSSTVALMRVGGRRRADILHACKVGPTEHKCCAVNLKVSVLQIVQGGVQTGGDHLPLSWTSEGWEV